MGIILFGAFIYALGTAALTDGTTLGTIQCKVGPGAEITDPSILSLHSVL